MHLDAIKLIDPPVVSFGHFKCAGSKVSSSLRKAACRTIHFIKTFAEVNSVQFRTEAWHPAKLHTRIYGLGSIGRAFVMRVRGFAPALDRPTEGAPMRGIPLILCAVLLGAAGQVIMKRGMQIYGEVSAGNVWRQLIPILKVPQVTLGLLCYAVSAVLWIAVVSKFDLSLAYPMVSVAYVAVFVASWLLFGENISAVRLAGLVLIVAGVLAISRS